MFDAHKNFSYSTVYSPPSPPTTGTSLGLVTGGGANFPAPPFNIVVWPPGEQPLANNAEILRVTGMVGDVLAVVRQQEGTVARSIVAGDQVGANVTLKTLTDIEAGATGPTGATGATGATGPASGTYIFNQLSPSASWTITHNLGQYPSVEIVDSAGTVIIGDVQYVSDNVVTVHFSSAFSGTAYLN